MIRQGVLDMAPTMNATIDNIQMLSPASYEKASTFIEDLLRIDSIGDENASISDHAFNAQVDALFDEYDKAFSVLAQ